MKKTSHFIILLFILFSGSFMAFMAPPGQVNDLVKQHLKGEVKSIMETRYQLPENSGKGSVNKVIYQKFTLYDENGYEQEIRLYKNNEVYLTSLFINGNDGSLVEMNEYYPDGSLNLNVTYTLNEKGNKSEALYSWSEDRTVGEICEMVDYYFEIIQNVIFTKVQYQYEYRGYCTQEDFIKADGGLSFRLTTKYDFRGNKLESAYFKGDEMLSWITKYEYDRYDNLIKSRVFKSNRIAVYSEYKYQFDDIGNWINRKEKREVYVNILTAGLNQSDVLTERTIEYY
jgi:hypothetical protein